LGENFDIETWEASKEQLNDAAINQTTRTKPPD
jgi:hypothetical protein